MLTLGPFVNCQSSSLAWAKLENPTQKIILSFIIFFPYDNLIAKKVREAAEEAAAEAEAAQFYHP